MLSGRRYLVRFTPDQLVYADEVSGICRSVWNTGLDQRRQYRQRRAWINYHQQAKELVQAKTVPRVRVVEGRTRPLPATNPLGPRPDLQTAWHLEGEIPVQTEMVAAFRFPDGNRCGRNGCPQRWAQVNLPRFGRSGFGGPVTLGGVIRSATTPREGVHGHWRSCPCWWRTASRRSPAARNCQWSDDRGVRCNPGPVRWALPGPTVH